MYAFIHHIEILVKFCMPILSTTLLRPVVPCIDLGIGWRDTHQPSYLPPPGIR